MRRFNWGDYNRNSDKFLFIKVLMTILILGIALVGTYFIFQKYQEIQNTYEDTDDVDNGEIRKDQVVYKGETYRYNYNMKNILIMGIDKDEADMQVEGAKGGHSDFLMLVAFNRETKETTLISIPRDTMAQVKVYNMFGSYEGIEEKQITLAYAYGEGKVLSANLACDAVSKLFYGIQIDRYYALGLNGIPAIHKACGDVTVTLNEEMPELFPGAKAGDSVVIEEDKLERYLRYRNTNESGSSLFRVERHNRYIAALTSSMKEVLADSEQWSDLYEELAQHMVTNLSITETEDLLKTLADKDLDASDIITLEGEMKTTDKYDEYHVDEDKLYHLILNTFYQKIS